MWIVAPEGTVKNIVGFGNVSLIAMSWKPCFGGRCAQEPTVVRAFHFIGHVFILHGHVTLAMLFRGVSSKAAEVVS